MTNLEFEMKLMGFSPTTINNYLICVSNFAKYYDKSLELLCENEIRNYLHYCSTEKFLGEGTVNYYYSALKFFYTKILDRES